MTVVTIVAIVAIAGVITWLMPSIRQYINSTWQNTANSAINSAKQ
jgi:Tfp pilus assembly protein PilE